jgi:hypothetical protein
MPERLSVTCLLQASTGSGVPIAPMMESSAGKSDYKFGHDTGLRSEIDGVRPHVRKRKRAQASQPARAPPAAIASPAESRQVPQSSFLGRSGYITSTDLAVDEEDAMQYETPGSDAASRLSELQSTLLRNASSICLPPQSLKLSLTKSFLERGRPWMPIIDQSDLDQLESQNPSSLLLSAVLVAGSKLSTAPNALEWGEKCYFYAKSLFFHGSDHTVLQSITASVLLHWWNPSGPEHVSLDSSSLWLRISVGLAHQLGLHREPDSKLPEARLRRRLWWTLVVSTVKLVNIHLLNM